MLIQPQKNEAEFRSRLEIALAGLLNGKPWSTPLPKGAQTVKFTQFGRFRGVLHLPPQAPVKNVSTKALDGPVVKAAQSEAGDAKPILILAAKNQ